MKKIILTFVISVFVIGSSVSASGFGSLQTANTLGMGKGNMMGVLGVGDATTFAGVFTYGLSKNTDGRLKLGLIDAGGNSDANIIFGADFKYNIVSTKELNNGPFDMAIGGIFEYYDFDFGSLWFIGGQYIGSYPILMKNNSYLTPYGRVNVRIESVSGFDSELEVGFNGGVKWQTSENLDLYGEIQLDDIAGFYFGIDFKVM